MQSAVFTLYGFVPPNTDGNVQILFCFIWPNPAVSLCYWRLDYRCSRQFDDEISVDLHIRVALAVIG
jgi:hypothetical protein